MFSPARIALAAAAVLALTACTSGTPTDSASPSPTPTASPSATPTPTPTPTPTSTVPVSSSLDAIKVTGKPLAAPKVEFKAPFAIDKTRVEVLKAGTGPKADANGYVSVQYQGVNGRTGKVFDESFSAKGDPITFPLTGVIPGFQKGLTGQQAGSRVLIGIPGPDGYDPMGGAGEDIKVGDTLLFVVDIVDVSLTEPSGKVITPPSGLPTVSPGTGKPTITIPSGDAPTTMTAQVLIEGTGRKVAKDDTILVRYVGVSWKTGQVVDDHFATADSGPLSSTIPGWIKGLEGKTVGSRVLLVLPPAFGFPKGSNNPPLEAGDTIVYVVDLLFAYPTPGA